MAYSKPTPPDAFIRDCAYLGRGLLWLAGVLESYEERRRGLGVVQEPGASRRTHKVNGMRDRQHQRNPVQDFWDGGDRR